MSEEIAAIVQLLDKTNLKETAKTLKKEFA